MNITGIEELREAIRYCSIAKELYGEKFQAAKFKLMKVATPELLSSILDQLEAERQRADNLSELYHATEKAVFKIAKTIKGDAFDKYSHSTSQAIEVIGAELEVLREEKAKWVDYATQASNEVDKLKAKLANPVVLPELCSVFEGEYADSPQIVPDQDGYVFYSHRVIESIIIAGFTVKE